MGGEQRIGPDQDCTGLLSYQSSESLVDRVLRPGACDCQLEAESLGCDLNFGRIRRSVRIARIDKKSDRSRIRHSLMQYFKLLCGQQIGQEAHARDIAARAIEACNEAELDWVRADSEHDRDGGSRGLGCLDQCGARGDANKSDLTAHQIGGQRGREVVLPLRPAILNGDVSTLDISGSCQSVTECRYIWRVG